MGIGNGEREGGGGGRQAGKTHRFERWEFEKGERENDERREKEGG